MSGLRGHLADGIEYYDGELITNSDAAHVVNAILRVGKKWGASDSTIDACIAMLGKESILDFSEDGLPIEDI